MVRAMISPAWKGIALAAAIALPASAAPVELVLAPGGGFDVDYFFSTGQSTTGRDELSGHILAELVLDDADRPTTFFLTGGRIAHADSTIEILLNTSFLGNTKVQTIVQGTASLPQTQAGSGVVDPDTGVIANFGHRLITNEGTLTTRYLLGNTILDQSTRNLATQPDNSPLVGTTTLIPTLLAETGWWKRCHIQLVHVRDEGRSAPVSGVPGVPTGTTYTVYEQGGFTANGEALFPGDDFIAWSDSTRGTTPRDLDDLDPSSGQPLLVMYALDAAPGPWQVPVEFRPASSEILLHLPATGLRAPVKWEYWTGTATDSWQPLAGTPQSGGITPFGSAGTLTLPLPPGTRGFVRASVPTPN
jgi:hypothetical protein